MTRPRRPWLPFSTHLVGCLIGVAMLALCWVAIVRALRWGWRFALASCPTCPPAGVALFLVLVPVAAWAVFVPSPRPRARAPRLAARPTRPAARRAAPSTPETPTDVA